jgi:hypothetical protein
MVPLRMLTCCQLNTKTMKSRRSRLSISCGTSSLLNKTYRKSQLTHNPSLPLIGLDMSNKALPALRWGWSAAIRLDLNTMLRMKSCYWPNFDNILTQNYRIFSQILKMCTKSIPLKCQEVVSESKCQTGSSYKSPIRVQWKLISNCNLNQSCWWHVSLKNYSTLIRLVHCLLVTEFYG